MQCGECRESEGGKERRENKMFEFLSQAASAGGRVGILLFIPHHTSVDLFKSQRRPEPALLGLEEGDSLAKIQSGVVLTKPGSF